MSTYTFATVKSYWFALLYSVFYQLTLILGDYILLGRFKLGDEALDISGVYAKFSEFRSDGDFIFYDRRELIVELVMIHFDILC